MRPIAGATQPPPLPSSSTAIAQPRSRCAVLRSLDCHVLLKAHVASLCFEYFRCFRCMLQVFQMDVVKVDRDVAYVAMVVHVYCKGLLPMFHLCFSDACCKCVYLDVAYVLHIRCMCFIWVLHMVAIVSKCVACVFLQVFQKHVSSVSTAFRCMLQLFYLDVSKVNWMLHLSSPPSAASSLSEPAGHTYNAAAGSFRIGGVQRETGPAPLIAGAARAPRAT